MTLQPCTEIFILIIQQYFSTRAIRGELPGKQVRCTAILYSPGKGEGRIHATVRATIAIFIAVQCRKLVEILVQRWKCKNYFLWHQILVHRVLPHPAGTSILQYIKMGYSWEGCFHVSTYCILQSKFNLYTETQIWAQTLTKIKCKYWFCKLYAWMLKTIQRQKTKTVSQ